ncbi:MAG: hypothetical protein NVSMB46_04530 [Candidatus Saccharimonadales bacterium]
MPEKSFTARTIYHSIVGVITALLLLLNVYIVRSVDTFGSPLFFTLAILIEIILAVIFLYSVLLLFKKPLLITLSVIQSAWGGIQSDKNIKKFRNTHRRLLSWLQKRLDYNHPRGLFLTSGVIIASVFAFWFLSILQQVILKKPITQIDIRILNLIPTIRTSFQSKVFRIITFFVNTESILVITVLGWFLFWKRKQKFAATVIVAAVAAEEFISFIIKESVGRVRPEASLRLIHENSYSFPSGHALRVTFIGGIIAYILYRSYTSYLARIITIVGYIITIFLICISRIYLGVHYPSDVIASVFLGGFLLTIFITIVEIIARYNLWQQHRYMFHNRSVIFIPLVLVIVSLIFSPIFIKFRMPILLNSTKVLPEITEQSVKQLPLYSETLTGKHMEPINSIYIGTQQQISQLFTDHGWYRADPSTIANTLKAVSIGYQGRQYITAPVTPSYLNAHPEDMAFEQPTKTNTLRERHHTRLWKTQFITSNGYAIWEATASFDEGVEFAGPALLPTHHINPNVDAERTYITQSLGVSAQLVQVVDPQAGKNASGDLFFTDGKASIVNLSHSTAQLLITRPSIP